ncbi:MAG: surface carbohydrate biosynthesis protein [Acidobacteriota bacterium]
MKRMRIALVVDNPFRDLPGLVLTGMKLCQAGHTCYLVPLNLLEWETWSLAPDFILLNYLKKNNQSFARRAMDAGIRVGVLDTEGGVFANLDVYGEEIAPDAAIRDAIHCFCSWGPKLAEWVVDNNLFSDKQISVTGCPRLDFYADPWRNAAMSASSYVDEFHRPLVLVNGIFTLANPAFRDPAVEARGVAAFQRRTEEEVFEWQRIERQTLQGFVDMTAELARRFPDASFVYRPHPFERLSTYHELFPKLPNLHAIKRGTVDGWLLRASALIQRGCSTATEASLLGIPALTPEWIPAWTEANETASSVSILCPTLEVMSDRLEAIFSGVQALPKKIQDNISAITSDFFLTIDGQSHRRVAEAVQDAAQGCEGASLDYCARAIDGVGEPGAPLRRRVRAIARRALGQSIHWSFAQFKDVFETTWEQSDKYFGFGDVCNVAESIQKLTQNGSDMDWTRVSVRPAADLETYRFGYLRGKSIALLPV